MFPEPSARPPRRWAWGVALLSQFVFVFSIVALSGPGRLDIDDGRTRFEVAQSLVDHGDPVIRDPDTWFTVLPGRYGLNYSNCRLPHSALGTVAIWLADHTGPVWEARRHFFFALIGAVAAGVLAVTYSWLFRWLGWSLWAALGWGTAGVFCTPSWYYGTSTFDDVICAAVVVASLAIALVSRQRRPLLGAMASGLLIGLAFNCKQPLAIFVLAVLAAQYDCSLSLRAQWPRIALVLAGLAIGVVGYEAYELYKFPLETRAAHAAILKKYDPVWTKNPWPGILSFVASPGCGVFWYCPPVLLSLVGLVAWWRGQRLFCLAVATSSIIFVVFFSFLVFFKGDLAWGPRYLTPIFAALWIFVPAAASRVRPRLVGAVLAAGIVVQLLGLSVDPHRLYLQRNLWSRFYVVDPWVYFDPAVSHLVNRPREIIQILAYNGPHADKFTPARSPTYCPPIIEWTPGGTGAVRRYHMLNSLRPFWISQRYLAPAERPVDLARSVALLLTTSILGLVCLVVGGVAAMPRVPNRHSEPVRSRAVPAFAGSTDR